jgi:predicted NBD/HSP70 family sugar kinase
MAKRQFLKAVNRSSILNAIKAHGAIARADIARLTGLSPATVTFQTAELIEDGLVIEKQEGDSRGGRPPILLALASDGIFVMGIKLAEEHATFALTDLNSDIIEYRTISLGSRDLDRVADALAAGVRDTLRPAGLPLSHILGVGIGMPGMIDSAAGICRMSPFHDWRDVPIADLVTERLDCPVYLDNDVNTLTLVERLYGPGQHVDDFLVVTIGRGVGLGIVMGGQVYRGAHGGGGEFGHTIVDPDGFVCGCGRRGCVETFVADPWLVRHANDAGLTVETPEQLTAAALDGNAEARAIFSHAGEVLGLGLANLINIFDPSLIIVSGEGVQAGDYIFPAMHDAIHRHAFDHLAEHVTIRIEALTDETWARGAASLVLGRIFTTPDLRRTAAPVE